MFHISCMNHPHFYFSLSAHVLECSLTFELQLMYRETELLSKIASTVDCDSESICEILPLKYKSIRFYCNKVSAEEGVD